MLEKRFAVIGILLLVSLFLVGEALGNPPESQEPAQALKARATEYWQHRIKRNYEKSYGFENPGRIKGMNLTTYIGTFGGGVKWLGSEVEKVTVKEKTGLVLMKIRYLWSFSGDRSRMDMPKEGLTSKYLDRWDLVDGTWYHQFRNTKGARPRPQARTGALAKEPTKEKEEINNETGKKTSGPSN